MITLEDLFKIIKRIKKGDTSIDIPCCANCEHYVCSNEPYGTATTKGGINALAELFGIDSDDDSTEYECRHPVLKTEDSFIAAWLETKPEDFCSRYKRRKT